MDFSDKRLWYGVVGVIVILLVIAYAAGWFSGTPTPPLTPIAEITASWFSSARSNVSGCITSPLIIWRFGWAMFSFAGLRNNAVT